MSEETEKKTEETAEAAEKPVEETVEKPEERIAEKPPAAAEESEKKIRKRRKGIFSYYKVWEEGLTRLRPFCERCGPGFFMADHGDRYTCGHCGFARYKRAEKEE